MLRLYWCLIMASEIKLVSAQWDDLKETLRELLQEQREPIMLQAANEAAVIMDNATRGQYPPPKRRLKQPFKTAKQRAWWWATLASKASGKAPFALPGWKVNWEQVPGKRKELVRVLSISGEYKRSGTMIKSLSYKVKQSNAGRRVSILYGTKVKYARYVIGGPDEQANYHKENWPMLQRVLSQNEPKIIDTFAVSVERQLMGRLE